MNAEKTNGEENLEKSLTLYRNKTATFQSTAHIFVYDKH